MSIFSPVIKEQRMYNYAEKAAKNQYNRGKMPASASRRLAEGTIFA